MSEYRMEEEGIYEQIRGLFPEFSKEDSDSFCALFHRNNIVYAEILKRLGKHNRLVVPFSDGSYLQYVAPNGESLSVANENLLKENEELTKSLGTITSKIEKLIEDYEA